MNKHAFESPGAAVAWALRFEAGLGLAAILLGLLIGHPALAGFGGSSRSQAGWDVLWGTAATLPLFALLVLSDLYPIGPLRSLQETMDEKVLQLFAGTSLDQLALIAFAAGLGEELLFRGVLQTALIDWTGVGWGIGLTALFFGGCHYISHTYAAFAAAIGLYLGLLYFWTGNLVAPIVTHGLYDFLALAYLLKWRHRPGVDVRG